MLSLEPNALAASLPAEGKTALSEQVHSSAKGVDAGSLRQEMEGVGLAALEFLAKAGNSALASAQEHCRSAAEASAAVTDGLAQAGSSALSLAQEQAQAAAGSAWACVAEASAGVVDNLLIPAATSAVELAAEAAMEAAVDIAVEVAAEAVGVLL